ncbi:hypothetical protein GCM10010358_39630 [Streptomyces minutiscleroticus]|uniref:Transposase n=1 Tax=Streptomyces minutiscleroticus TaxID=68238 RepID=A0A918NMM3_9ACTN|nr:hypothetical protein GCM10010358_39630 [Streptomyces minutiscleroticus]
MWTTAPPRRVRELTVTVASSLLLVTTAGAQDSVAGAHLLDQVAVTHPGVRKAWASGGCRQQLIEHAAILGIDMEIVRRPADRRGFAQLPRRWAVKRTLGRLMFHRRLARDYETLSARSEAMTHLAMTDLVVRRLTGEATVSWRDPAPRDQT